MKDTTIHLTVVIDDPEKTTYTISRKLTPVQLAYLHSVVHLALDCMLSGLVEGNKKQLYTKG